MITQYCLIRNQTINLNGKVIFSGEGAMNDFLDNAYSFLKIDYPKFYKMDNLSKLGFLAAEAMLKDRCLMDEYTSDNIAIVLSNAHGSLDTDKRYLETAKTLASPALFVYTLPNIVAGEICIRHKIKGENAFFICKAFDPTLMAEYVDIVMVAAQSPPQESLRTTPSVGVLMDNPQSPIPNAQCPMPNPQSPNSNFKPQTSNFKLPNACLAGWIDVLGAHHDVFLYLLENNKPGLLQHTAEKLEELYNTTLWNN